MPYSYVQYVGNGTTTTYAVPFPYLDKTHVEVTIGETLKAVGVDYNWSTPNAITFTTAPANTAVIKLSRKSHQESRLVDFQDGSTLTQEILDLDSNQTFFMAQESIDRSDVVIAKAQEAIDAKNLAKQYAEWAYKYERLAYDHMEASSDYSDQAEVFKELAESAAEQTKTSAVIVENARAQVETNTATVQSLKNDVLIAKGLIDSQANLAQTILTEAQNVANEAQNISTTTLTTAQAAQALADQLDETTSAIIAQQTVTLETKTAAEAARDAAISAKTNAETAAETATTKASVATSQANIATTQATTATTQAVISTTQATQADNSAKAASASSVSANNSATSASTAATNAATSATQAAASAASAAAIVTGVASNRPSIRPSLLLDFSNTKQLDPRITFSRPTIATYYDGKTVVKAEENLLLQSQFASGWNPSATTLTSNATTAPDGTSTAGLVVSTATTGYHSLQAPGVTAATQAYVVSVYAKAQTYTNVYISEGNLGRFACSFDLTAVTAGTPTGNNVSNLSSTITAVGNGWYRCAVYFTPTSTAGMNVSLIGYPAGATLNAYGAQYTGDGTSGIYLWGAQLEQRSTVTAYTPTTTAPITNYIPALQTAAAGVPRFDHDPVTGESKGFLIEEQRSNLLTYSDDFSNVGWGKSEVSVTSNIAVAPDGTLTADKIVESTAAASHLLYRSDTMSYPYAASFYAKAGERSAITYVNHGSGGVYVSVVFNLANGTISQQSNTSSATYSASIIGVGNGWYRCSVVLNSAGNLTSTYAWRLSIAQTPNPTLDSYGSNVYTGNGYSGLYIWGAQLEAGSFPTSYIPTVASQVTRSADSASMTGSNFSSWYRADEGTVYSESYGSSNYLQAWAIGLGNSSGDVYNLDTRAIWQAVNGFTLSSSVASYSTPVKLAATIKSGSFALVSNGTAAVTSSQPSVAISTFMWIGRNTGGWCYTNGCIKRIAYWPKRLSNTELQGLTS